MKDYSFKNHKKKQINDFDHLPAMFQYYARDT